MDKKAFPKLVNLSFQIMGSCSRVSLPNINIYVMSVVGWPRKEMLKIK